MGETTPKPHHDCHKHYTLHKTYDKAYVISYCEICSCIDSASNKTINRITTGIDSIISTSLLI